MKPCLNNNRITYAMKAVTSTCMFACFYQPEVPEQYFFLNTPEEALDLFILLNTTLDKREIP